MRLSELRSNVQPPTSNPYDAYFTRHVSILVTASLSTLGISANQVSAVNLFVGLGACALIAFGDSRGVIAGIVLVHVYAVLDSVDGELARLRRKFSLKGLFLEDLSAFYMIVAFPLAVANHLMRADGGLLLLGLAGGYAAFGRNGMAAARRALLKSIRTKRPISADAPTGAMPDVHAGPMRRVIDGLLLNHTIIRAVVSIALLVETAWDARPPVVTGWILAAALAGLLVREVAAIALLLRNQTLDRMLDEIYRDARVVNRSASEADGIELARS
jgi:hypothetical protein